MGIGVNYLSKKVIVKTRRRDIRKIIKTVNFSMSQTQINRELFEADENMTLIRTIVAGNYVNDNASEQAVFAVHKAVHGSSAPTLNAVSTTVGDLYANAPAVHDNLYNKGFRGDADALRESVDADVKGMRKLKKGDKIFASALSSAVAGGEIFATVTLFFKE